ncbi:hypothetical protein OA435_01060 [Pelagibacteraceae bacterium]|nr:hypothetical protein [Pelagibacteraceae bacterium]
MEIKEKWLENAKINEEKYSSMYNQSIQNNDKFWSEKADRIDWIKKFTNISNVKYSKDEVNIKWFEDGNLNVSYNCIDRHAKTNPEKVAIIWEGDEPNETKKITYKDLLINVSKAANVLKKIGVKKR